MDKNLPELLEMINKRPALFVHPISYSTVNAFLTDLSRGLRFFGIEYTWDEYRVAAESRGFDPRGNVGIVRDLKRKGLSDEAQGMELLAVVTDAYSRAVARLNLPDALRIATGPRNNSNPDY